jgi:hypothetical protein
MDWKQACVRLWGEDWIAPLSEVLKVSRRTVERWKAGTHPVPEKIERELIALVGGIAIDLSSHEDPYNRAYGDMMRRLASGESPDAILLWLDARVDAFDDLIADCSAGFFPELLGKAKEKT